MSRDSVFVSYAHSDKALFDALMIHLKPFVRNKAISLWSDTQIGVGDRWRDQIEEALNRAKVAILLVSPAFLASDFIAENELPVILRAVESRELRIIWVPVKPSAYEETTIKDYQAAHDPGHPISMLSAAEQDAAWVTICKHIKAAYTA